MAGRPIIIRAMIRVFLSIRLWLLAFGMNLFIMASGYADEHFSPYDNKTDSEQSRYFSKKPSDRFYIPLMILMKKIVSLITKNLKGMKKMNI